MTNKRPDLDMAACTGCGGCLEIAPTVFIPNPAGYIEVADLEQYPQELVREAIAICPADAITWEE